EAVRYADSALSSAGDALPAGPLPGQAMPDLALPQAPDIARDHLARGDGAAFMLWVFAPAGVDDPVSEAEIATARHAAGVDLPLTVRRVTAAD
ncbi:hypothetical protein, partial [Staphylococcus aureus]|uniref:hypothetical protein n=1 Tax=Staphylococcus aureus TaxID=1280 RepID=UPI00301C6E8E